jgi:hypothetical protein
MGWTWQLPWNMVAPEGVGTIELPAGLPAVLPPENSITLARRNKRIPYTSFACHNIEGWRDSCKEGSRIPAGQGAMCAAE